LATRTLHLAVCQILELAGNAEKLFEQQPREKRAGF
jgi:hypothetical protein